MKPHKQTLLPGEPLSHPLRTVLSLSGSIVVSFLILMAITQARQPNTVPDDAPFEELRAVVLPPPPPPPPPQAVNPAPLPPSLQSLDLPASDSTIRISVSPAPPAPPTQAPVFKPVFDFSPDSFKPSTGTLERQYVYQKSEVEQPPIPVYKNVPGINLKLMGDRRYAKVSLMYIVNTEGRVEEIKMWGSGGKAFDQAVLDGVQQWRFKPAIKDGEKVNCWVRQSVVVKSGSTESPFRI